MAQIYSSYSYNKPPFSYGTPLLSFAKDNCHNNFNQAIYFLKENEKGLSGCFFF